MPGAFIPLGDLWDSSSGGQEVLCFTPDSYLLPGCLYEALLEMMTRESPFAFVLFLQDLSQDVRRCKTNKEGVFSSGLCPPCGQGFPPVVQSPAGRGPRSCSARAGEAGNQTGTTTFPSAKPIEPCVHFIKASPLR